MNIFCKAPYVKLQIWKFYLFLFFHLHLSLSFTLSLLLLLFDFLLLSPFLFPLFSFFFSSSSFSWSWSSFFFLKGLTSTRRLVEIAKRLVSVGLTHSISEPAAPHELDLSPACWPVRDGTGREAGEGRGTVGAVRHWSRSVDGTGQDGPESINDAGLPR